MDEKKRVCLKRGLRSAINGDRARKQRNVKKMIENVCCRMRLDISETMIMKKKDDKRTDRRQSNRVKKKRWENGVRL